ncbi:MAG: PAS domain-containing protein [Chloroflexota bacterium]
MQAILQRIYPSFINYVYPIWHWLIEPSGTLEDVVLQRKMRLLATLLVVLNLLLILVDVANMMITPYFKVPLPIWVGHILLVTAYGLNKLRRYHLAAWATSASFLIVGSLIIFFDVYAMPAVALTFFIPGIILSSILLSMRDTIILACTHVVVIFLLLVLPITTALSAELILDPLALNVLVSFLIILSTHHRNQDEQDRQAQLLAGKQLLEETQAVAQVGSWEFDLKTQTGIWSQEMYQIYGRDPSLGAPELANFLELVHPDDLAMVKASQAKAAQSPDPVSLDFRIKLADSKIKHVHARSYVYPGKTRPGKLIGTVQDITERKQGEEALHFQKMILECQIEAALGGILVVSNDREWLVFNQQFIRMWGIPEEIQRNRSSKLALQYVVQQVVDAQHFLSKVEYLYHHPAETSQDEIVLNDSRIFERYSAPVTDRSNVCYGRVWYFRDITDQKLASAQAKQLARRLQVLHDIDKAILGTNSPEVLAESTIEYVRQVLSADRIVIAVFDTESHTRKNLAVLGISIPGLHAGSIRRMSPDWFETVVSQNQVSMIENIDALAEPSEIELEIKAGGIQSYITFPFVVHGKSIGAMSAGWRRIGTFAPEEVSIGREIADTLTRGLHQVQLNEALRNSEEQLSTMFRNSYDEILVVDAYYNIQFINRTWQNLSLSDVIGMNCLHYLPEQAAKILGGILDDVFLTGTPQSCELFANGSWYFDRVAPIKQGDTVVAAVINATDVSEQKLAEKNLNESLNLLRLILDTNPHYIYWKDSDLNLVGCNKIFAIAAGFDDPSDIVGKSDFDLPWTEEEMKLYRRTDRQILDSGQPLLNMIRTQHRADDQNMTIESSKFPLFDDEQNVIGILGVYQDITERNRAEQELLTYREHLEDLVDKRTNQLNERVAEVEKLNKGMLNLLQDLQITNRHLEQLSHQLSTSNQELESFSYSVSHDLRAPLRHVNGFIGLLLKREEGKLDPTSTRYLRNVASSAERMSLLIDDLLALSRTSRIEIRMTEVDLNSQVASVQQELRPEWEQRNIVWKIAPLPTVFADANLLRLVWINLLSNAIKYTSTKPQAVIEIGLMDGRSYLGVESGVMSDRRKPLDHDPMNKFDALIADQDASEITVFVRDNGVGFDAQYKHKLFGVFQRLHRREEFEGTGIGLATVRRIMHRHGGRTWADGAINEGATFYLSLPQKVAK